MTPEPGVAAVGGPGFLDPGSQLVDDGGRGGRAAC